MLIYKLLKTYFFCQKCKSVFSISLHDRTKLVVTLFNVSYEILHLFIYYHIIKQ
jgi:hypothetical protein